MTRQLESTQGVAVVKLQVGEDWTEAHICSDCLDVTIACDAPDLEERKAALAFLKERAEIFSSIVGAMSGSFDLLAKRLVSGANLDSQERSFLAELITDQNYTFRVTRKDARIGSKHWEKGRKAIAEFVHWQLQQGVSHSDAVGQADVVLRPNKAPNPKYIEKCYREFYDF